MESRLGSSGVLHCNISVEDSIHDNFVLRSPACASLMTGHFRKELLCLYCRIYAMEIAKHKSSRGLCWYC